MKKLTDTINEQQKEKLLNFDEFCKAYAELVRNDKTYPVPTNKELKQFYQQYLIIPERFKFLFNTYSSVKELKRQLKNVYNEKKNYMMNEVTYGIINGLLILIYTHPDVNKVEGKKIKEFIQQEKSKNFQNSNVMEFIRNMDL